MTSFFCRGWSDLDKIAQTCAEWHVDCGDVAEIETICIIPIWRTFGQIQWHVTQSHVSHCRVLPLGEFTVTIPEPHATLQGACWRNQCHDRVTLQSVKIPSALLSIVFRHILFFCFQCSLGFDERRLSYSLRYTCCFSNWVSLTCVSRFYKFYFSFILLFSVYISFIFSAAIGIINDE